MGVQNGFSSHAVRQTKRRLFSWLAIIFLLLLFSMLTGLIALHPLFTYQTYEQGSCSILSGDVKQESTKNGSYYYYIPVFEYTLQTKDGQQVDTFKQYASYTSQEEAQQVVNHYNVGQTYQCWYNPAHPTRSELVLPKLMVDDYKATYIGTSIGFFLVYTFLWSLFYYGVYRQRCLMRRGVLTEGRVVEHFVVRTKSGLNTHSRIVFSPLDDSSHSYKVAKVGEYEVGSLQPVCYDPLNPRNARYGGRPNGTSAIGFMFVVIVGIMVLGTTLIIVWNAS
jgi:Protein of unknown function (DUF3592)